MRLALYYSLHTTWNQLRKLFRTWMFLIALGIVLGGGLIGLGAVHFSQQVQTQQDPGETPIPQDIMEFFDASGLDGKDAFELGTGLAILSILTLQIFGAEKSVSRLFLPADVNFLFTSDRSPQEVLSFRLFTTLGTAVVASVYLFFQLPSLVAKFHISSFAAGSILIAWCMTLAFSILLKILTFELASRHPVIKRNLRFGIILFLAGLFFLLYHSYQNSPEQVFLLSAHRFFNAPWTRWIPVWGWLKGIVIFALEGNYRYSILLMISCLVLILILLITIRIVPIDYYEEASIRCEEIALYMENVNSDTAGLLVTRTRKHDEKLKRDGFHYGSGSTVYFFKTLYNRFRFARFGFLTKAMITCLLVAVAGGLFVRFFMEEPSVYPPVALLAVTAFFRTIASPMIEDIRKDSFIRSPENTWLKLFWSLAGGSVNCALDTFLPLMLGSAIAGLSPLRGLLFLPLLVSIDFFATAAGTFVDVAIPPSIDKTLKQVIQILFLYFGMIPDEMIISFGLITHHDIAANLIVVAVNLLVGGLFLGLAGVWLNPTHGSAVKDKTVVINRSFAKSAYSRIGFALLFMYACVSLTQYSLSSLTASMNPLLHTLSAYLPIYLVGIPVFLLCTRHMQLQRGERTTLSFGKLFLAFTACLFLMYTGNFIGMILQAVLNRILPFSIPFKIDPGSSSWSMPIQTLCICVLSPLMEEFVFRKSIIDRLHPFGERTALIVSALLFGLFHGNLQQFVYATLLGLVFGYIYLKTNHLRYSLVLHMIINTMGSVIARFLVQQAFASFPHKPLYEIQLLDVLFHPAFLTFFLYLILLIILYLFGLVSFAYGVKEKELSINGCSVGEAFSSIGMVLFIVVLSLVILFSAG